MATEETTAATDTAHKHFISTYWSRHELLIDQILANAGRVEM